MIVTEIFGPDSDEKGRIAVFGVTGMETHAIDNDSAGLGSRSDDMTAGTHAEGIDTTSVRRVADQFVGSGAERRMTGKGAVLRTVNKGTRMFNADTHRKGLLHHTDSLGKQGLDGIPGGMPDAQENRIRTEFTPFTRMGKDGSFHMAAPENKLLHTGFKKNGAAKRNDFLPDGGNHSFQPVRADMRHAVNENILRRAVGNEGFQNGAQAG